MRKGIKVPSVSPIEQSDIQVCLAQTRCSFSLRCGQLCRHAEASVGIGLSSGPLQGGHECKHAVGKHGGFRSIHRVSVSTGPPRFSEKKPQLLEGRSKR